MLIKNLRNSIIYTFGPPMIRELIDFSVIIYLVSFLCDEKHSVLLVCVITVAKKGQVSPRVKYRFEEAWRFLYRYGVIYLQNRDGIFFETKTGLTRTNTPSRKILRFVVDGEEYARVCIYCWEEETSCGGKDIVGLRASLIDYIDNAVIG